MTPKSIEMAKLKVGDLFTHKLELKKRKAFTVLEVLETQIDCIERGDPDLVHKYEIKPMKKTIKGNVYLLRRKDGKI